ncbi:MAG TPA: shikimate kinase [Capsulimonadaceae bacterium]
MSNIILIGIMGAGKSAVGRRLAERAGARFVDTDREIEREHNKAIAQIFETQGEAAFREIETQLLRNMLERSIADHTPRRTMSAVFSTGGGVPLRPENAELLKQLGHVVWLRARADTIANRVGHKLSQRPLIADYGHDLVGRIRDLQSERYPRYEMIADYIIDTDECANPDQAANLVFDHWKRHVATPKRHHDSSYKHNP